MTKQEIAENKCPDYEYIELDDGDYWEYKAD
jgi:hypothetical protein